jgi:hypothetical protein
LYFTKYCLFIIKEIFFLSKILKSAKICNFESARKTLSRCIYNILFTKTCNLFRKFFNTDTDFYRIYYSGHSQPKILNVHERSDAHYHSFSFGTILNWHIAKLCWLINLRLNYDFSELWLSHRYWKTFKTQSSINIVNWFWYATLCNGSVYVKITMWLQF